MKREQREKVTKEYYDVFIAKDGTEFTNAKECSYYEETAYGVISARFCAIAKKLTREEAHPFDSIIDGGCGSTTYYRLTPKNDVQLKILLEFCRANDCYFAETEAGWGMHIDEVEVGTTYIVALYESGSSAIFNRDKVEKWCMHALEAFNETEEA